MTRAWALFWGLVFVAIGAVALLYNLDLIRPEQVGRLVALWPLLLILLGVQIVLARVLPRHTAAVATSVVCAIAILGSVAYVATTPAAQTAEREFTAQDAGTAQATLKVSLGAADILVAAAPLPGEAATATLAYSPGWGGDPVLSWNAGTRTFQVERRFGALPFASGVADRLRVTLDSSRPWRIDVQTGGSSVTLDGAALSLRGMTVNGGALNVTLRLSPPSGRVAIDVNGGAIRADVSRPAAAAFTADLNGGASSLSVDGREVSSGVGHITWSSPGYPAPDAYALSADGGAVRVSLTS